MSKFQIIVGSMLGGTEYVAEACEEQLKTLNHDVNLHLNPDLSSILKITFDNNKDSYNNKKNIWLICTSTHGAGDFPDNIQTFVNDLKNCEQDLSSVTYLIIATGDSNYDTFCKAGYDINKILITKGCNRLLDIKTLDMSLDIDPEELAQLWIDQHSDLL